MGRTVQNSPECSVLSSYPLDQKYKIALERERARLSSFVIVK